MWEKLSDYDMPGILCFGERRLSEWWGQGNVMEPLMADW